MILIPEFRTYVTEKAAQLPGVNFSKVVVKEAEVLKFLNALKSADNQIMMAVMPDARSSARDEDNIRLNNATAFLFLEKVDYGAEKYENWLDVFERTQETAVAFMHQLVRDKSFGTCGFNRFLDVNNMTIEPVSGLASCNGWTVEVYFDTPF